jgi:uncharacterized protein (TIGR02391 family)
LYGPVGIILALRLASCDDASYNCAMRLTEIIPTAESLLALEPSELGLRMLPFLLQWPKHDTLQLTNVLRSVLGEPIRHQQSQYPLSYVKQIDIALRAAWTWLEGQALLIPDPRYMGREVLMLSPRAQASAKEPRRALSADRLPKSALHPAIRENVWNLYLRGQYDTAITEAMKAFEVAVRKAAGYNDADYGAPMIVRAFHEDSGPLRDPAAQPAERKSLRCFVDGAFGLYRNAFAHRNVALADPDEAAEIILVASHLLRIVDARVKSRG